MSKTKSGLLFLVVFGFAVYANLSPKDNAEPQNPPGQVLGSSVAESKEAVSSQENEEDDAGKNLKNLVQDLIRKREKYQSSECAFIVSEKTNGVPRKWEGKLIWNGPYDYEVSLDGGRRVFRVRDNGEIFSAADGDYESLGYIDDNSSGSFAFREISNYIFENFLLEMDARIDKGVLIGEETADGTKRFVFENVAGSSNTERIIRRKFWISEEGIFVRAEIEDRLEGSGAAAVEDSGDYVRNIILEIKDRSFSGNESAKEPSSQVYKSE